MKPAITSLLLLGLTACAVDDGAEPTTAPLDDREPQPRDKLVRQPNAIPGRYIVVMRPSTARRAGGLDAAIDALAAGHRATIDARYRAALHGFSAAMAEADARALADHPDVDFVEEDTLAHTTATTQAQATWGLDRIDQQALPLDQKYTFLADGAGVTAYVLDTGLRATHGEFTGRVVPGATAIQDGQGTNDCQGHGTHVAGTIAGTVLGVAKRANVVAIRVLDCQGSGPTSGIIAGIDYVAANAVKPAVANMSLGGPASAAEDTAVRNLVASGVTVVVSAGNDNRDACLQSPARTPEAITVAASDMLDKRAGFSNFGTCVDVFAPGVDIRAASFNGDNLARNLSGTSQASPHVAGAVALYLSANPAATPAQVAQALVGRGTTGVVTDVQGSPNVMLAASFADATAPVAGITSPANGATVAASFEVTANVTEPNLASVRLTVDGRDAGSATEGPFAFAVSGLAQGAHELVLTAVDLAGQSTTSTVTVTVRSDEDPGDPSDPGDPGDGSDLAGGCSAAGGSGGLIFLGLALALLRRRRRV